MRNSNYIYILLLFITVSCENKGLKTELANSYTISAENEKDTLQIDEFKILKTQNVDFDYVQKIKINNLNHTIDLNRIIIKNLEKTDSLLKRNIQIRHKMIGLNTKKKDEYLTLLEHDQNELESTKHRIKKIKDEIAKTHQRIVLIRAEFGQNQNKYELIDYVFKGKINNQNRIDTLSVLRISENNLKFIKNDRFTTYKKK